MPVEDLNEEQSKGLWTYTREQDLKMQQRLGFLPKGFDVKAAAKGGKEAKDAAAKGVKSEEETTTAVKEPEQQQPKEDFEKKVKDFTKKF